MTPQSFKYGGIHFEIIPTYRILDSLWTLLKAFQIL